MKSISDYLSQIKLEAGPDGDLGKCLQYFEDFALSMQNQSLYTLCTSSFTEIKKSAVLFEKQLEDLQDAIANLPPEATKPYKKLTFILHLLSIVQ